MKIKLLCIVGFLIAASLNAQCIEMDESYNNIVIGSDASTIFIPAIITCPSNSPIYGNAETGEIPDWLNVFIGPNGIIILYDANNTGQSREISLIVKTSFSDVGVEIDLVQMNCNDYSTWYFDVDGDEYGYGDPQYLCAGASTIGYVQNNLDNCPSLYGMDEGCPIVSEDPYEEVSLGNENYIFTRVYQRPVDNPLAINEASDVIESVTYFDGLGRPMQNVEIRASDNRKDILTHIGYDDFGRQDKDWLPIADAGSDGSYRGDISAATKTFYRNKYPSDISSTVSNQNAYSEKLFEASPLNRVLKQGAPGDAWRLSNGNDKGLITFSYETNVSADQVKLYGVSLTSDYTPTLKQGSTTTLYYDAGELYKTVTKDENHDGGSSKNHTTEEFKDKQGRVVLKRTYGDSDTNGDGSIGSEESVIRHDTYYVYDDFGNLTYVLSPKIDAANKSVPQVITMLNELGYQYKYDHRNRLIEKKIPGKGKEYIVYNKLDQPAMTQDANLASQFKWLFTKYDAFGRVAYTGLWTGNSTNSGRLNLQGVFDVASAQYETRQPNPKPGLSDQLYYNNEAKPIDINQIYTINYYDSYLPTGASGRVIPPLKTTYDDAITTNVKTLPTVSRVRVLTTNDWITTTTGYDTKGRAIWIRTVNDYLDTDDIVEMKLDFTGKVLESRTTHKKLNLNPILTITTEDFYTYDHMGRMEKHTQKIDEGNDELIALNEYDELGQLKTKKVGNTTTAPLQTVDYTYNIRGWLKTINDPTVADSNKLFAFKLNYNTTEMGVAGVNPLYNGNISETIWRTANTVPNGNGKRGYAYQYDALNRIKSGVFRRATSTGSSYSEETNSYDVSGLVYDLNGSIERLNRRGFIESTSTIGDLDKLKYDYFPSTNRLRSLDEDTGGNITYGFKDGSSATQEYYYDANGNMTRDLNKDITASSNQPGILYNHLNLPTEIKFSGNNNKKINYFYTADGIKQKKVVNDNGSLKTTEYAGNYIYEAGALKFFNQPEGYVEKPGTLYEYVYQYKDHLGNIRLSYKDINGDGDIDVTTNINTNEIVDEKNYYPFGLEHKGYNNVVNGTENPYKYNGKELNEELGLGWYDYGARFYDPALSRFMTIDPKTIEFDFQSPYAYAVNNPIFFVDKDGEGPWPLPTGAGIGIMFNRAARTFRYMADGDSFTKAYAKASYDDLKEGTKQVTRYATPAEDIYGVFTGKDFDGQSYNRAAAGAWAVIGIIPGAKLGKAFKALKFSDEVADIVKTSGKLLDDAGKEGKEIVTILKEGSRTSDNAVNVAKDIVGDLGDDAVEQVGKLGGQKGKVTGYKSADGKKGWRVDFDSKKGAHINWWNGKEKGAILFDAGENQVNQIINNEILKSLK